MGCASDSVNCSMIVPTTARALQTSSISLAPPVSPIVTLLPAMQTLAICSQRHRWLMLTAIAKIPSGHRNLTAAAASEQIVVRAGCQEAPHKPVIRTLSVKGRGDLTTGQSSRVMKTLPGRI